VPDVNAADVTLFVDVARSNWKFFLPGKAAGSSIAFTITDQSDDFAHRNALVTVWSGYRFLGRAFRNTAQGAPSNR